MVERIPFFEQYRVEDRGYETPCWMWQGATTGAGYGVLQRDGRKWGAHRWFWEQVNGPIPEGLEPDHLCRNRACVNLEHLELVTRRENARRGDKTLLTEAQVREILARFAESDLGGRAFGKQVAAEYGVSPNTIRNICSGRSWHDLHAEADDALRATHRICPDCGARFHRQGYPNHRLHCIPSHEWTKPTFYRTVRSPR